MGDMIKCGKCQSFHYRNDGCADDRLPRKIANLDTSVSQETIDAVPLHIRKSIDRFVEYGVPVGSFLWAILTNDLFGAIQRADEISLSHLHEICAYVYNAVPSSCWGTDEKVHAHCNKNG